MAVAILETVPDANGNRRLIAHLTPEAVEALDLAANVADAKRGDIVNAALIAYGETARALMRLRDAVGEPNDAAGGETP